MKRFNFKKSKNKGFYIALILCIGAIAISSYIAVRPFNVGVEDINANNWDLSSENVSVTVSPINTPEALLPVVAQIADGVRVTKPTETLKNPTVTMPVAVETDATPMKFEYPLKGKISVPYSPATLIYSKTYEDWRVHKGVDIAAQKGDQVKAVADGKVEKLYVNDYLGITIEINHGIYKSIYSNLSTDSMVKEGQEVKMGDIISGVGDSAIGEIGQEPHLHFELMKDTEYIDPMSLLK